MSDRFTTDIDGSGSLLALAREAKAYAHNPYDEPAEGAAVAATDGDDYVAVPGVLVENGNYTNTRKAAETAVFNALVRGYDDIDQLAVARDGIQDRPLRYTTHAVCDTFLNDDSPVTVDEDGAVETFRYDSLRRQQPQQLAPELAPDAVQDMDTASTGPVLVDETYDVLHNLARGNRANAYTPSSGYNVGAVLFDADGQLHPGNNIEPDTGAENEVEKRAVGHGEETAILHWQTFSDADPVALAVASTDGGNCCGYCTQWMAEFFDDDVPVYNVSDDDAVEHVYEEIDPHAFRLDV